MNKKILLLVILNTVLLTSCGEPEPTPSESVIPSIVPSINESVSPSVVPSSIDESIIPSICPSSVVESEMPSITPSSVNESISPSIIPSISSEPSSSITPASEEVSIVHSSEEKTVIERMNEILNKEYTHFVMEITTTKDDLSLTSLYNIVSEDDGYHIQYDIEKYNVIDLESGSFPSEMKSHEKGSYISQENEYSLSKFDFNESLINDYSLTESSFTAYIANGKEYLNTDYNINNLVVSLTFNNSDFSLDISYSLDDGTTCSILIAKGV